MFYKTTIATGLIAATASTLANAGTEQIIDLRIGPNNYSVETAFETFAETTREADIDKDRSNGVQPYPVDIRAAFTGASQNTNVILDPALDVRLKTFTIATHINNLSRFKPSVDGGVTKANRIGMAQWNFDLTPLDNYLTTNGLNLDALDIDFNIEVSDHVKTYDFYLSYTNPAESITLTSIDDTTIDTTTPIDPDTGLPVPGNGAAGAGGNNFTNFWDPAVGSTAGDIINGQFKVLHKDHVSNLVVSDSILALYNAGVREFNLQLAAGDFWSGRQIKIFEGSGISVTTSPGSLPGDLDGDGFVGIDDLNLVLGNWNLNVPPANPLADPSGDNFIGIEDLNAVLGNWNAGTPPASGAAVPEPATLGLIAIGGFALLKRRP